MYFSLYFNFTVASNNSRNMIDKQMFMALQQTPGYSNRHLFELPAYSNRFSFPVDIP